MTAPSSYELTLDLIYDAVVDPSLWIDVLKNVVSLVGGEAGVLSRMDILNGTGAVLLSQHDDSVLNNFYAHYHSVNVLQIVDNPAVYTKDWVPKIVLDEQCLPREQLERSEYYNEFLRPISAEWSMIVRLGLRGSEVAAISVGRSLRQGRFEAAEIAVAARLQSHLVRAYALSEKVALLHQMKTGFEEALEQSPSAMFLLNGDAGILHVNPAGQQLLGRGDVLRGTGGRLTAIEPSAGRRLEALIAAADAPEWERRRGGSLSLPLPNPPFSLEVTASPLRLRPATVLGCRSAVLVCVAQPAKGSAPVGLGSGFALTPAEARIASALCEGLSLREAADLHEISINTARVQLSSVFSKTGVHRQADLIRLGLTRPAGAVTANE